MLKRVLLKLSGESLGGPQHQGLDVPRLQSYASEIAEAMAEERQVAIVVGGGNIFRGLQGVGKGFDRYHGDQMGMLATVINSLAIMQALRSVGQEADVLTAVDMHPIGRHYSQDLAIELLRKGHCVIVAGGTGNPFFTTDSAAALRAIELHCDALLKGTRVDGVYSADPEKDPAATRYEHIAFSQVIDKKLRVMDLTSMTLCAENDMPIHVFDMDTPGNLTRLLRGDRIGTRVDNNE